MVPTQQIALSRKIPTTPYRDELIFMEGEHIIVVEKWRIDFYRQQLPKLLPSSNAQEPYFVQLRRMLDNQLFWAFFSEDEYHDILSRLIDPFSIKEYVISANYSDEPSILLYSHSGASAHWYEQTPIGQRTIAEVLYEILNTLDNEDKEDADNYIQTEEAPHSLQEQFMQLVERMRNQGFSQQELLDMMREPEQPMQPIFVTNDLRIMLPNKEEIRMTPLERALYVLYLQHPEGIAYPYLQDHMDELATYYRTMVDYRFGDDMARSISDLVDVTGNSINEKCARIKRAFVSALGAETARHYYITGPRGAEKGIALSRRLVEYEDKILFHPF